MELADAGIALQLPPDWEVLPQNELLGPANLPEDADHPVMDISRMMQAFPDQGAWCNVYQYDGIPMSLDDHGAWFAYIAETSAPSKTAAVTAMKLPIGDVVRVIETAPDGAADSIYLFDLDGVREYLACGTPDPPDDAWLSIAESIESFGGSRPSDVPADAVAWHRVEDFDSVVPVVDTALTGTPEGSIMSVSCQQALWLEYTDGTFEERIQCTLSDAPVDPPEWQGTPPAETITVSGGACEWASDFWAASDGSEVWASSYEVTVSPDGQVSGSSRYGAEALDCGAG